MERIRGNLMVVLIFATSIALGDAAVIADADLRLVSPGGEPATEEPSSGIESCALASQAGIFQQAIGSAGDTICDGNPDGC